MDGTGPSGKGSKTGRGMGRCGKNSGRTETTVPGSGSGRGRKAGGGRGQGQGQGTRSLGNQE